MTFQGVFCPLSTATVHLDRWVGECGSFCVCGWVGGWIGGVFGGWVDEWIFV